MSVINSFSSHLKHALAKAMDFARDFGHDETDLPHLLYGLAAEKGSLSSELLAKVDFPVDLLKQELIRSLQRSYMIETDQEAVLSDDAVTVLTKAARTAQLYGHTYIGTEHVLACLIHLADHRLKELFRIWNVNTSDLQRQLLVVLKSTSKFPDLTESLRQLQESQDEVLSDDRELPVLHSLAKELTDLEYLKEASPLIGRAGELERLQEVLARRYKNNPLLVGEPGVGKTAIVEGLAQLILSGKAPEMLEGKRIFQLELNTLVAGTMYRGEFEQRLKAMMDECRANPDIILFIDEIHTLIGAGSTGQALDGANILKPALARGEIRCIGATTWNEYQKFLKPDAALARRFQTVSVAEPTKEETREILRGVKKHFEQYHHVAISKDALDASLDLSERYLAHTNWPDKALDLIDEASAKRRMQKNVLPQQEKIKKLKAKITRLQKQKQEALQEDVYDQAIELNKRIRGLLEELQKEQQTRRNKQRVTAQHVEEVIATRTGIEPIKMKRASASLETQLRKSLSQKVVGQDHVHAALAETIQRAYSPLKTPDKPLGSFLFLGPSGVGKTATARALAEELFLDRQALIKLDMSEYSEKHSLSKLLGAPAGYVGYQDSGILSRALQKKPASVILFDEVEKAHPELFNILLQILDEGIATDATGQQLNFKQTVIILTSNLGTEAAASLFGFGSTEHKQDSMKQEMQTALKEFFRPELLNRLDKTLYFHPLGIPERTAIIEQKLSELNARLEDRLQVIVEKDVVASIAQSAYVEQRGVRSLEQFFRDQIELPLSRNLHRSKHRTARLTENDGTFALDFAS